MYLESIKLRDWKAFEDETFTFPAPANGKNVVLIGGKNGFGKTTLFEALALGLYGRDGLPLVMRAKAASTEAEKIKSFNDFMERALFAKALAHGRNSCHIALKFIDDNHQPIWIERTWYFNDQGKSPSDAPVVIYEGTARKLLRPSSTEMDKDNWYRAWLARTFLPASLAGFFLFDGEAASVYAERDMGIQVRDGIEGLLGLDWLRQLRKDLETYARSKRASLPKDASTLQLTQLDAAITGMETEVAGYETRLRQIEADIQQNDAARNALTLEIGNHTGTRAQLEELVSQRADHEKHYQLAQEKMQELAANKLPFALAGTALLTRVDTRLDQEAKLEQWQTGLSRKDERTAKVMDTLDAHLPAVNPSLQVPQVKDIRRAVEIALERLWHPVPDDIADAFRHGHLHGPLRARVQETLNTAHTVSSAAIIEWVDAMRDSASIREQIDRQVKASERTPPQVEEKRQRLETISQALGHLREQRGALSHQLQSRHEELEQKRKERARLTAQLDQSQQPVRLAGRAEQVAQMLDNLIRDAWPLQTEAVADAMTSAIQEMAHRSDYLHRVSITPDGEVALHSPDGRNLRNYDLSAGEKQIFTQALFSAVASVSGCPFPLVVDTPLGRLDKEHRLNVLKHLAHRRGQVILISTNTEVVGESLAAIRDRVAKCYLLQNQVQGDVARSWCKEGYFAGQDI